IRARSLKDWLPNGVRKLEDGTFVDLGYECSDFHKTNAPTWLGFSTIATIDLDHVDRAPARTSIVTSVGTVYASESSLYLAAQHWWWWPSPGQESYTYLYKFDISSPDRAVFVAAGGVDGYVLNQFSMDEEKGYLRAATTIDRWVPDTENKDNRWGRVETSNRISVLAENEGKLELIGKTEEIEQ